MQAGENLATGIRNHVFLCGNHIWNPEQCYIFIYIFIYFPYDIYPIYYRIIFFSNHIYVISKVYFILDGCSAHNKFLLEVYKLCFLVIPQDVPA